MQRRAPLAASSLEDTANSESSNALALANSAVEAPAAKKPTTVVFALAMKVFTAARSASCLGGAPIAFRVHDTSVAVVRPP